MKIISLSDLPEEPVSHNPEVKKKVFLKEGDLPSCITKFAQARFAAGQTAGAHAHTEMYEVLLVEEGDGLLRTPRCQEPLGPGICVVMEPDEIHDIVNTGEVDLVITYFGVKTERRIIPGYD
jgi:mannose-6-phosphate isomerase-like protein (cupin superfamily)